MTLARLARLALVAGAILAGGAAIAGASPVGVATGLLATSSKSLTHATCTLTGTAQTVDTFVEEAHPWFAHATSTTLLVSARSPSRRRAYLMFNPSSCAATIQNAEVDSATLTFTVSAASSTPRTLQLYRVTAAWASSIAWYWQPEFAGSSSASDTLSSSVPGSQSVDLTGDVNDFVQSAPTLLPPYVAAVQNFGWMIADEGFTSATASINASEARSGKPTLTIVYAS